MLSYLEVLVPQGFPEPATREAACADPALTPR